MAKTNEAKLWLRIKNLKLKAHFTRIESSTLNGIPDVNVCDHGAHYWLELKSNDLKNCGLSKWQINWHCDRIKSGGYVFILNQTLVPRALKLLAMDPVSRAPFLVSRFKDNEEGMRQLLEDAASRVREARFSFLVDRS
ncbi:MAG: hypothetical protein ACO36B_06765 [Methylophilaceae bacterium]